MRGDKFILEKLWQRVKEFILFLRGRLVMKMKTNASTSSKIEKFDENPKIEENEK